MSDNDNKIERIEHVGTPRRVVRAPTRDQRRQTLQFVIDDIRYFSEGYGLDISSWSFVATWERDGVKIVYTHPTSGKGVWCARRTSTDFIQCGLGT